MKRIYFHLAAGAAASALAAPAAAAAPLQPAPLLPRDTLEAMCGTGGAAGYAFGARDVPRSSRLETMLTPGQPLSARFAPFATVQLQATPWSSRLAFASYEVPAMDAAAAATLSDTLSAAFEAAGWQRKPELEDGADPPMYLLPVLGTRVYELPGPVPLIAGFGRLFGSFTLSCGHKDLLRANAEEAIGELPPGTPRPQPPAMPAVTERSAADCDRAEVQRELLTVVDGHASNPIALLLARASHAERLAQWKRWRLRSSGRVSSDRMMDIMLDALNEGSSGGDPMAAFTLMPRMMDALRRVGAQAEAGQSAAACRTSLELVGIFRQMEAVSAAQWRAMDAALEAEARRLRISLD